MRVFRSQKSEVRSQKSEIRAQRHFLSSVICLLISVLCLLLTTCNLASANNINISNTAVTDQSTANSTCAIQFDVSWNNSWKNPVNYDAAWVFIKYSTDSGTTWKHATLKANDTNPLDDDPSLGWDYGSNSDAAISVPTDKKGAFIHRTADAIGTFSSTGVKFVWDWSNDYLSDSDTVKISAGTTVYVKVFAVEMVYIPEGTFSAGSGGSESGHFTQTYINTADATTAPTGGPPASGGYPSGQTAPANASWPNGYGPFYIMKYEFSQGQYADFLSTLTSTQASARYANQNGNYRHTISGTYPNYSASRPDRACNYISWADLAAYADWAGLRPFTELEFEKACRGTATAVANEYAWGSTDITQAVTISGTEDGTETITTSGANCCYNNATFSGGDGSTGPLRCGIFASLTTTREQAGASYYGVMELSGSVWERPVTIGNSTGRAFTGLHGDGALDSSGNANVTNWPGTNSEGTGFRGGEWYMASSYCRASDRFNATSASDYRFSKYGGRCARSAP